MQVSTTTVTDLKIGQRVQTHPASSFWWRGERFGTVEKIGRKLVHVRLDRSNRLAAINPLNLFEVA